MGFSIRLNGFHIKYCPFLQCSIYRAAIKTEDTIECYAKAFWRGTARRSGVFCNTKFSLSFGNLSHLIISSERTIDRERSTEENCCMLFLAVEIAKSYKWRSGPCGSCHLQSVMERPRTSFYIIIGRSPLTSFLRITNVGPKCLMQKWSRQAFMQRQNHFGMCLNIWPTGICKLPKPKSWGQLPSCGWQELMPHRFHM